LFGLELDSLHPITIHFPIALLTCTLLFDVGGLLSKKKSLSDAAFWCQLVGTMSLIPAIVSGFWADESYGHMDDPFPIHTTHGSIQITVGVLFLGLLVWRLRSQMALPEKPWRFVYLGLYGLLVMSLTYGSHLGAILGERL